MNNLIENKKFRLLIGASALMTLALLFVPGLAHAIPGSGEFISTESTSGRAITKLYDELVLICWGILILVEVLLIVAILKFRRTEDNQNPVQNHGNLVLEIGWTLAVVVIQIYIAWIVLDVMDETEVMPETEITVEAIAYQWGWQFKYPDYDNMITDDLVVPAHTNVKLEVTSKDVIHAIFIPALGVKIDAVPGRYNYWWFNADGPVNQVEYKAEKRKIVTKTPLRTTRPEITSEIRNMFKETAEKNDGVSGLERRVKYLPKTPLKLGEDRDLTKDSPFTKYSGVEYLGMCAEICGTGHSRMYFRTVAMTKTSFEQWVFDQKNKGGAADGKVLYEAKCASCHGAEGKGTPPAFPPLIGTKWMEKDNAAMHIEVVLVGSSATSLKGSTNILGQEYAGVMAAWNDAFNDEEIAALVNHERTSWGNDGGEVTAADVEKKRAALGLPPFPAGGETPISDTKLLANGRAQYSACSSCHGIAGVSSIPGVPNLKANPTVLADTKKTISIITNGIDTPKYNGACPPMATSSSAYNLSSLLTYIRKSFGNERSSVQPSEARRLRNELEK